MLRPGQLLGGKYRVERLLGEGGMGTVVAARHEGLGELVAIKVLHGEIARSSDNLERLRREARAMARLRSEYVARVTDVGTLDAGEPYLVMEFVRGVTLRQRLAGHRTLPAAEACSLLLQACEGLAEAHWRGVVHRDVKPSNLMLTERPDGSPLLKILDFGIAKTETAVDTLTDSQALLGSPLYMAPEQMRNAHGADARSDIWALGVTLYEILTGKLPFQAFTTALVIATVLADEPAPPRLHDPTLPEALSALVLRCLAKNPDERFADVEQLALALAPFAPGSDGAAERIGRILRRPAEPPDEPSAEPPPSPPTELAAMTASRTASQALPPHNPSPPPATPRLAYAAALLVPLAAAGLLKTTLSGPTTASSSLASLAVAASASAASAPATSAPAASAPAASAASAASAAAEPAASAPAPASPSRPAPLASASAPPPEPQAAPQPPRLARGGPRKTPPPPSPSPQAAPASQPAETNFNFGPRQ